MNSSGIRTTCQHNVKIIYPNEQKPHLWSANTLDNFGFDSEKLSFYADGCAFDLSEDGTSYTLKSAVNDNSMVNLKFTRTAPGFQIGKDGKTLYGTDLEKPWGSMRHAFWPRCVVEGEIATKDGPVDFKGRGLFIMALQGMKPHHAGMSE